MAHYAYREEHPLPAMLMHWFHMVATLLLIISGLYIHSPFLPAAMGFMRSVHLVFMWVFVITAVVRLIWAFVGRSSAPGTREVVADRRHFGWQRENRGTFGKTVSYYLFMRKRPPAGAKYNPLQKGTYLFWLLLIIAQTVTGFLLWDATQEALLPVSYALGGLQYVRMYHYLIMWLFIITVLIHVYLSALHPEQMRLMLGWRETGDDVVVHEREYVETDTRGMTTT